MEYYLFARGRLWKGGKGSSWIGPVPMQLERCARLTKCDAHEDLVSRYELGQELCLVCGRMSRRFVTQMPKVSTNAAKSNKADLELLGGEGKGEQADDDTEDSSVSDTHDEDEGEVAGERPPSRRRGLGAA